jgi:uncharacterized protein YjbI with pentapeptide repeats
VHRDDVLDASGHGGIVVEALRTPHATLSTSEGRFVIEVPPEALTLRFSAPGYGTLTLDVPRPVPEQTTRLQGEVLLTGRPGAVEGTITLTRFGTPEALLDVTVRVSDEAGRLVAQVHPGDDGRFLAGDLAPGAHLLEVSHFGYLTELRPAVVLHGEVTRMGDVALRHASDTPAAVPFAGVVRFDSDEPLAGTVVRIRFADREVALTQAVTAPDGRFEASAAMDDRYTVTVERPGFETLGPVGPYSRVGDTFVDEQGRAADLTLTPGRLDGRVDVGFEVEPAWLPAQWRVADVTLSGTRATWSRPGAGGRPEVTFDGLPAGLYTLRVTKPGFVGFEGAANLRLGNAHATFDGRVRLADLAAARVQLRGVHLTGDDLVAVELVGADLGGVVLSGSLRGRDLTGVNLSNATLAGVDLTDAILDGARLFGADLSGATLAGARLIGAQLAGADLSDADLQGADLTAANLSGATLENARFAPDQGPTADPPCDAQGVRPTVTLTGAIFSGANLRSAHLRGVYLPGGDFSGALLAGANLAAACIPRAAFTLTDLSGAHLEGADARGAAFANAVLSGAHLQGADLHGARFVGAVLEAAHLGCRDTTLVGTCTCPAPPPRAGGEEIQGAPQRPSGAACRTDLSSASLDAAALVDADLAGAVLSGASLLGSLLSGTNMVDADLSEANMAGVDVGDSRLRRADLSGARLAGARLAPESDLRGAILTGADMSAISAAGADLRGLAMEGVDLSFASLAGADVRGASLVGARLVGTDVDGAYFAGTDLAAVRLFNTFLDATADLSVPPGRAYGPPLHLPGADLSGRWDIGFISLHPGSDLDGIRVADGAAMTLEPPGLIGVSLRGATIEGDAVGGVPVRARDDSTVVFRYVDLSGADVALDFEVSPLQDMAADFDRVVGRDASLRLRTDSTLDTPVTSGEAWPCASTDADSQGRGFHFPLSYAYPIRIRGSDFSRSQWYGPVKGVYFGQSNLDGAAFHDERANGAQGIFVSGWMVSESSAVGLDLGNVGEFADASFRRTDLRGFVAPQSMTNVRFFQTDLRDADLVARTAAGLTLRTSDLRGAHLDRVRFDRSCLDKTQNGGMSLRDAALTGTTLRQLDLRGIDLTRAQMIGGRSCETFPLDALAVLYPQQPGLVEGSSGTPPWCGASDRDGELRATGPTSCYEGIGAPGVRCWSASGQYLGDRYTLTNATRYAVENTNVARELFQAGRGLNAIELVQRTAPFSPGVEGLNGGPVPDVMTGEVDWASTMAGARIDTATIAGRHRFANSLQPLSFWSLHGTIFGQSTWPAGATYSDMDFSEMVPGQATGPGQGGLLEFWRARFTPESSAILAFAGADIRVRRSILDGARLSGAVLAPNSRFTESSLVGAQLVGVMVAGLSLAGSTARDADFSRANLIGAELQTADLAGATLAGANLAEASFGGVPVGRDSSRGPTNLAGADLTDANLDHADLTGVLFDAETKLTRARLADARLPESLRGVNLEGVSLASVNWNGADLRGASLARASIVEAEWNDVVLIEADLQGAQLTSVRGHRLQLQRADLRQAILSDGRFTETRFDEADLRDADLQDSDLSDSDFTRADLRGATLPPPHLVGEGTRFDRARLCASALSSLSAEQASVVVVDPGC